MYHRPVCVNCNTEMRCWKNGVGVLDYANEHPYQLWEADIYRCPTCGLVVVVGFAQKATEVFEEHFTASLNRHNQQGTLIHNYPESTIRRKADETSDRIRKETYRQCLAQKKSSHPDDFEKWLEFKVSLSKPSR